MNSGTFKAAISALALGLSGSAISGDIAAAGPIHCAVNDQQGEHHWQVEFDEKLSLASVDESDSPAEFSPQHIRIRLSYDGPVLTIGRVTGRVLATDKDGNPIGAGRCTPVIMV